MTLFVMLLLTVAFLLFFTFVGVATRIRACLSCSWLQHLESRRVSRGTRNQDVLRYRRPSHPRAAARARD